MNGIEVIILLLLLFMTVPDFCRWLGRPALRYPLFVVFGLVLSPFAGTNAAGMLQEAGQVGFLLLLFEVGLEIDLPPIRQLLVPLRKAMWWILLQYPVILALGRLAGLHWLGCFIAAAAFTGCSVGMAHAGWRHFQGIADKPKHQLLMMMVVLEIIAIVLLSVETALYESGLTWLVGLKLVGITITVLIISQVSTKLRHLFELILARATRWRVYLVVFLVLLVCAVGERLGLSAIKTAFFLGLFMSRIQHDNQRLEDYIAPISRRFLIPIFFVSLGLQVPLAQLASYTGLMSVAAAAVLFGWRLIIQRRFVPTGGGDRSLLLLCPNLTIAALAGNILLTDGSAFRAAVWILLTGLIVSISAILLLPKNRADAEMRKEA
ncbi:MAG: cation:proton antiporter [Cephaloticoccus sp.]|nr:cation:proton antiporter [Cephaloticoccus sp.]